MNTKPSKNIPFYTKPTRNIRHITKAANERLDTRQRRNTQTKTMSKNTQHTRITQPRRQHSQNSPNKKRHNFKHINQYGKMQIRSKSVEYKNQYTQDHATKNRPNLQHNNQNKMTNEPKLYYECSCLYKMLKINKSKLDKLEPERATQAINQQWTKAMKNMQISSNPSDPKTLLTQTINMAHEILYEVYSKKDGTELDLDIVQQQHQCDTIKTLIDNLEHQSTDQSQEDANNTNSHQHEQHKDPTHVTFDPSIKIKIEKVETEQNTNQETTKMTEADSDIELMEVKQSTSLQQSNKGETNGETHDIFKSQNRYFQELNSINCQNPATKKRRITKEKDDTATSTSKPNTLKRDTAQTKTVQNPKEINDIKISDHRPYKGTIRFKTHWLKWKGLHTWEPISTISKNTKAIDEYLELLKDKYPRRLSKVMKSLNNETNNN